MSNVVTEFIETNWQLIIFLIIFAILLNLIVTELFFWLYDSIKTKIKERTIITPFSKDIMIPLTVTYMSPKYPNGYTWQTHIPITTDQTKIRQALVKDLDNKVLAYDYREEK